MFAYAPPPPVELREKRVNPEGRRPVPSFSKVLDLHPFVAHCRMGVLRYDVCFRNFPDKSHLVRGMYRIVLSRDGATHHIEKILYCKYTAEGRAELDVLVERLRCRLIVSLVSLASSRS